MLASRVRKSNDPPSEPGSIAVTLVDETDDKLEGKGKKRESRGNVYRRASPHRFVLMALVLVGLLVMMHETLVYLSRSNAQAAVAALTATMPALDFVVAGFPKCGTTSLLYAFRHHPAVLMSHHEVCAMKDKRRPEATVLHRYQQELTTTSNIDKISLREDYHRGIKCPTILYSEQAIDRLLDWYPSRGKPSQPQQQQQQQPLRWVVGLRHPLHQVQSYYNYLVTEVYDKGYWMWKGIHPLTSVLDEHQGRPWKDMTFDAHRYELHLERLLKRLAVQQNSATSTPLVFVYTLEQLETEDKVVRKAFQKDLASFLSLPDDDDLTWGHENRNHFTGTQAHAETINVCSPLLSDLRAALTLDLQRTVAWMEEYLMSPQSPYAHLIQVGQPEAFQKYLQSWAAQDICSST